MSESQVYPFQYFQTCPKCGYNPEEPYSYGNFEMKYLPDCDVLEMMCPHCKFKWLEYPADRFTK
jgi:hypothetical protein